MVNFIVETSPDSKKYFPQMSDMCLEKYFKDVKINSSWLILYARIFNLEYPDFLRMVRDVYGATLEGKQGKYIFFYFSEKMLCQKFVKDLNKRFDAWKKI